MGSWGGKAIWQGSSWWARWSHIHVQINQEGQLGSKTDCTTQGFSAGKESLKTSGCKNLWGLWSQEKFIASQESPLERPTGVLEHTQTDPLWNQHQKGPICLWVVGEVTERPAQSRASGIVPSWAPLPHTASQCSAGGCPALANTYGSAPFIVTYLF